jgi:hypothetical protein
MQPLSVQVQTLFAELAERVMAREAGRSIARLSGFFSDKSIGGKTYWYFKTSLPGRGQHEYYLGPETRALRRLIDAHRAERPTEEMEEAEIARLCSMVRTAGANCVDTGAARVIRALADAGLFRLGGILIGTHAFLVLGNVLGVRWSSSARTQDMDIAAESSLAVALPLLEASLPTVLDGLKLGFLPVPGLDSRNASTSYKVRGKELRVDFLTPAHGRARTKPVSIPRLGLSAKPMELLDYLMSGSISTIAVDGGATMVNVPDAARLALHRLAVAHRRSLPEQPKAAKDRAQAMALLERLHADRPGDVPRALAVACKKFPSMFGSIQKSAQRLPDSEVRELIVTTRSK